MAITALECILRERAKVLCSSIQALIVILCANISLAMSAEAGTVDLEFSHIFPQYGGGPIGCSVDMLKEACAADSLAAVPDITLRVLNGAAVIKSSKIVRENCIEITLRLWVDHKGYEGRECLAPFARAIVHVEFP